MDWKLELVVVPVTDVERAKRFYSEQVGFAVDHDTRVDDRMHIVQLTRPAWRSAGSSTTRAPTWSAAPAIAGTPSSSSVPQTATAGPSRSAPPTRMPWASVAERQTRRV
jgi:catechol 2,3-dioxygenase-like lactoylglutathione lyase family enzyme